VINRLSNDSVTRARQILDSAPAYFHTYAYAQFDSCRSTLEGFTVASSMATLLDARDPNDPAMRVILGCDAPKLRLIGQPQYVTSRAEALVKVRSRHAGDDTAAIELPEGTSIFIQPNVGPSDSLGDIAVVAFSANGLTARVRVAAPGGAWLVYADSYDRRWRAWVNEKPTSVFAADVGLKAVPVPFGDSTVRLAFHSAGTAAATGLALFGATCSACLLSWCIGCAVFGFPRPVRCRSPQ
jgi:hypothetical protein